MNHPKTKGIVTFYSQDNSKVKLWHSMKMWNETRVRNAVKMGWITKEEFAEITGKDYE